MDSEYLYMEIYFPVLFEEDMVVLLGEISWFIKLKKKKTVLQIIDTLWRLGLFDYTK